MVPTKPFLHREETSLLQIPHPPPHRALRHFEFPGHGGDSRLAEALLVGPSPQVQVHSYSPVGQVALVKPFKVCHRPAPFELPVSCCYWAVWR